MNLPADFASVTVPLTGEPAGIALTPPTDMEFASVPVNPCPAELVLELNPLPSVTDKVVPAGTTIGGGGGGGAAAGAGVAAGAAAGALPLAAGDAAFLLLAAAAGAAGWLGAGSLAGAAAGCVAAACSWSDDFLHPEKTSPADNNAAIRNCF